LIPYKDIKFTKDKVIVELSDVMYKKTDNSLSDNLEVFSVTFDAIGFKPKDTPKVKKLVRLKNKMTKLEKEIKELEDSLVE
jgi:hypothetical protein